MYQIHTKNIDDWMLILFNSEGKICYKAYIYSTNKGTISPVSQKVKLNFIRRLHTAVDDQ